MYAKYVCIQIEGAAGVADSGCSTYDDNRFSITVGGGAGEGRLQLNVEQVSVPPLTTTRQNGQTQATILYPLLGCNVEIKVTRHLHHEGAMGQRQHKHEQSTIEHIRYICLCD